VISGIEDVLCAGEKLRRSARVEAAGVANRGLAGRVFEVGLEISMSIDIL